MTPIQKIRYIKSNVEYILTVHPETRDNDRLLYKKYLETFFDKQDYWKLMMSIDAPTMLSVVRIRQKFNQNGLYVGKSYNGRQKHREEFTREIVDL